MEKNEQKNMEKEDFSHWKKHFQDALSKVKKVTSWGMEKSEKASQFAKHQVRRRLLMRERKALFQELGEMVYNLHEQGKLEQQELERTFDRLKNVHQNIQKEEKILEDLKIKNP